VTVNWPPFMEKPLPTADPRSQSNGTLQGTNLVLGVVHES
jgi:hypothetical protein